MRRNKMMWRAVALGALVGLAGGCKVREQPEPAPVCQLAAAALTAAAPEPLTIAGQRYSLTWEDDFGGAYNGGQPRSFLNTNYWSKENLGVNNEQQAYSNRECPNHPDDWNYCVENGRLSLRARHEALNCVVWKPCNTDTDCDDQGTCAATKYCVYDKNKNGVWDHDECAEASSTAFNGTQYTSGRIKSDQKVELRYGYIEFRARMPFAELPAGQPPPKGMWPAIWLLGADSIVDKGGRKDSVGWPMCGEIDIMEYTQIRENPTLFPQNGAMGFNTLWREQPEAGEAAAASGGWQPNACSAWPNNGDAKCDGDVGGARATWDGRTIDYHQWHTWGFLWDETGFQVYIDQLPQAGGVPVGRFSIGDGATEFRQPMFLILNNAVGGELGCLGYQDRHESPGACIDVDWEKQGDKAQLEVDYVRWFHRDSGYPRAQAAPCQDGNGDGVPDNLVRNCGFEEDFAYHRTDLFFEGGSGLSDVIHESGAHGYAQWVRIDAPGSQPYSVQVRQEGLPLQAGTTYQWKVDLKTNASAPLTVPIQVVLAHAPWTSAASFQCTVGQEWTTCAPPPFTAPASDTYKFEIDLGKLPQEKSGALQAYVDNMYLATQANTCQPECTGRLCGSDGCGGTCGTCSGTTVCGDWGQCVAARESSGASPVRLEAESATRGCAQVQPGGDSGDEVVGFQGGDSLCWAGVNMTGLTTLSAHVGAPQAGGQAQVRFNDTLLGTLTLEKATGGWSPPNLTDISTKVAASGSGTLCLVAVEHPEGPVFSVDYVDLK